VLRVRRGSKERYHCECKCNSENLGLEVTITRQAYVLSVKSSPRALGQSRRVFNVSVALAIQKLYLDTKRLYSGSIEPVVRSESQNLHYTEGVERLNSENAHIESPAK
jgi:hypothetical protein